MRFRTIKGVQDILPPDISLWQDVESLARQVFTSFGYSEIRPPIIEFTELFMRSIGETTDIVEKEMYTFHDRAGRSITLRPEGTASVVRAYVQNHLYALPAPQKYYYMGPMFRYERPQKGRFRQFHHIGVEAFGEDDPRIDAEVFSMLKHFLDNVGLGTLSFEVNSIGCQQCRPGYRKALIDYLTEEIDSLCSDCIRRYEINPLRVLDCKVEGCREVKGQAPKIPDYLCFDCKVHFETLLRHLELLDIPYNINTEMARGLDYYTRTTFEVTSESLNAQNAIAAGGRYNTLVEEFGGPPTPAIGFAIGTERLSTLLKDRGRIKEPTPEVYIATHGDEVGTVAFKLATEMRREGIWVEIDYSGASLKSQMRKADRLNANYVFILGEDELSRETIRYKRLSDGRQGEIGRKEVYAFLGVENRKFRHEG